jgi:hypothetical protein
MRIGAWTTVVGMLLTLIAMLPLFSDTKMSSAWWFLSMVTGVGLAIFCLGFWRAARLRSHAVVAALSENERH